MARAPKLPRIGTEQRIPALRSDGNARLDLARIPHVIRAAAGRHRISRCPAILCLCLITTFVTAGSTTDARVAA